MPMEHAWFGWDCYYPQINKNVTVFLNTEQGTHNPVAASSVARKYCGYESIYNKLVNSGHKAYYATPFVEPFPNNFDDICHRIVDLCSKEGNKYIYAYWNEPDTTMHKYGCYCTETKAFGKDFLLLTKAEVYKSGLFGKSNRHPNADGMLGDYVAIATTDLTVFNTYEEAKEFKGVHAGYTIEEMDIPFIVVEL